MFLFKKKSPFYREHLGDKSDHCKIIQNFEPTNPLGSGLTDYLKSNAFNDETLNFARTYLVRDTRTKELVGFYSLRCGEILQRNSTTGSKVAISGIELMCFAVNGAYKKRHPQVKTIGSRIFCDFILHDARISQTFSGAMILYIYALPGNSLKTYYERLGFKVLPNDDQEYVHQFCKPSFDNECNFMYMLL